MKFAPKGSRGAWDDFRVFMNYDHFTDTDQPAIVNIESVDSGNSMYGEYHASMISATTHGSDNAMCILGPGDASFNGNAPDAYGGRACDGLVGIVYEWNKLRSDVPETPDSGSDNMESSAFGDGALGLVEDRYDTAILDRVEVDNDEPPYSVAPGGYLAQAGIDSWTVREAHMATGQKSVMLPGCEVFCGLMQVETKSATDDNTIGLLVELTPGSYKGVHALEI